MDDDWIEAVNHLHFRNLNRCSLTRSHCFSLLTTERGRGQRLVDYCGGVPIQLNWPSNSWAKQPRRPQPPQLSLVLQRAKLAIQVRPNWYCITCYFSFLSSSPARHRRCGFLRIFVQVKDWELPCLNPRSRLSFPTGFVFLFGLLPEQIYTPSLLHQ